MNVVIPRTPWPEHSADVVIHGDLQRRNRHPNLAIAKAGNAGAALALVRDLLSDTAIETLASLLQGRKPVIVPVTAIEVAGFNAIPDAMAQELGGRLKLPPVSGAIMQSNKVAHTKADGWHRLVTPATFAGVVPPGLDCVVVDDHIGFGGTLANLRGYIEANGGHVLAMTTLTETGGGRKIAARPESLSVLCSKHGNEFAQFWRAVFGHGLDCLTNLEAGYLSRIESFDAIRTRMAQAAELARGRGLSAIEV
jgi:orotate phosphoribosyltransferase-like protein